MKLAQPKKHSQVRGAHPATEAATTIGRSTAMAADTPTGEGATAAGALAGGAGTLAGKHLLVKKGHLLVKQGHSQTSRGTHW